MKILDAAEAGDDLLEAITDLVGMGRGGDDPAIVLDVEELAEEQPGLGPALQKLRAELAQAEATDLR